MSGGLFRRLSMQPYFCPRGGLQESMTASRWDGEQRPGRTGPRPAEEAIMHPMFVKLFLEADADDLLADEEERRQRATRARNTRSRMTLRVSTRPQDRLPRR